MVYQYIFGRDTEIGYKTINSSTKLKADGEYTWQSRLNIDYIPPENADAEFPDPIVYFNIKDQTTVVGKITYQVLQQRNNYLQHYYLIEGEEREEFLEKSYQFDITNFKEDVESAYNTDIENQDIYNHMIFTINDSKQVIANQNIAKKVLQLIIFACFEAVSTEKKVFFICDYSNPEATENNLNLLKLIFSIFPPIFKEKLGFITYYKYLISPAGKSLRSDIKIIFTENSHQNMNNRNRVVKDGDYLFDFINNKTAVNTENIMYAGLLEFLTEPFYINRSIYEVLNVLNRIISFFTNPYKVRYNLAAIAYELFYKNREIDYRIANILFDNYEILGTQLKKLLSDWVLSDTMKELEDEDTMHLLLFKIYNYDEYKDRIIDYFAQQISKKDVNYVNILFEESTPTKLMENVCIKLLNEDKFLEGGRFLLHNCILNCKDKPANVFHPIEVFDIIKYFSQFSKSYYKYFNELEIYEGYFKNTVNNLDLTGFENLSHSFLKLIDSVENEATSARLCVLHRLILKRYLLPKFSVLDEFPDMKTAIDTCYKLLNFAKPELDTLQDDLEKSFRSFSLELVSVRNLHNFNNIDYYFQKAIENYKIVNRFLKVLEEILLKSFSKEDLSSEEYDRLFNYAKELGIKLDTSRIENYDLLEFNTKLKKAMNSNNVNDIVRLLETKGSYLKENTKSDLIKWTKGYKGRKDSEFYRLIIYIYADNYSQIFSFIEKDDTYTALKLYMKEMKNLGLSANKDYLKYLYNYISDDKKAKKFFKTLSPAQKKEFGLPNFSEINKQSDFDNPFILFIIIYFLFGIAMFLVTRTVNSIFKIDNLIVTLLMSILTIGIMYGFWVYKISEFDKTEVVTKILTAILAIGLVVNVAAAIIGLSQPRNKIVTLYKDIYNIKYDNIPPILNVASVFIDDGTDFNYVEVFKDSLDINENSSAIIALSIQDDNDLSVRANINKIELPIENKNIIKLDGSSLDAQSNELEIIATDIYNNETKLKLNLNKKEAVVQEMITLKLSGTVYNAEDGNTDYPSILNGFKLNVPKGGEVDFNFNVESTDKSQFKVEVKLNDLDIPINGFIFSDKGCSGKFIFNYDSLQAENTLNIKAYNSKESKEYKVDITKDSE